MLRLVIICFMVPTNAMAFKEWAVVCAALAEGRQSLVLRKGGIDEGAEGFRVAHAEFWLLPTQFHQDPTGVVEAARPLLERVRHEVPPAGKLRLAHYAVVHRVDRISNFAQAEALTGLHIWSAETVRQRFDYRVPGLFALTVRVYQSATPWEIDDLPAYAGCRSWVPLDATLSTEGLAPVLDEAVFAQQAAAISANLVSAAG